MFLIRLSAALLTIVGLTSGNLIPFNATGEIKSGNANNIKLFDDLIHESLQLSLDRDVRDTKSEAVKILDDMYRFKLFSTVKGRIMDRFTNNYVDRADIDNEYDINAIDDGNARYFYESIPVLNIDIIKGTYYYKNADSTKFISLDPSKDDQIIINDDNFPQPSFFNSITIKYPYKKCLQVGTIKIETKIPYIKYRVVHHLLEKLYFIGFDTDIDTCGTLYVADLRGDQSTSSVKAEQIIPIRKSDNIPLHRQNYIDIAVDQYTGNLLIATKTSVFALEKMFYSSHINQFVSSWNFTK